MPGKPVLLESPPGKRLFVIHVAIASFMGTLDYTIVNLELPVIADYPGISITLVSWIPIAHLWMLASVLTCIRTLC